MSRHTTAVGVNTVSRKINGSNYQLLDGKLQAIKKNLPVIDVGSKPNMPHSYWFIMWMAT
jgi:hypothetical protein